MTTTTFQVLPHVGAGAIRLGMSREQVRAAIGTRVRTFQKGPPSEPLSDQFPDSGVIAYFRSDDSCDAFELMGPAIVTFRGRELLGVPFRQTKAWIESIDPAVECDETGLTSFEFGFGVYAPTAMKAPDDPIEGVIVFVKNYYDRPIQGVV